MEDLKYVITYAVVNTKSTPIMLQALKKWKQNPDAMFGEWDKRATIPMDSEEGAALMGDAPIPISTLLFVLFTLTKTRYTNKQRHRLLPPGPPTRNR
jgi:hypothetical protein